MKSLGIWFCVIFLCACSVMKREVGLNRQLSREQLQLAHTAQLNKQLLYLRNDSSHVETEIELLPKGHFKFSPQNGFEGEAASLKIKKNERTSAKEQKIKQLNQQSNLVVERAKTEKGLAKKVAVKRVSFIWLGISALLIVIALMIWYLRRNR